MKSKSLTVLITVYITIIFSAVAQKNYYVVVGAFNAEQEVKSFTATVPNSSLDTAYSTAGDENLMQFYVFKTRDKEIALSKTQHLQNQIEATRTPVVGDYESIALTNSIEGKTVTIKRTAANITTESTTTDIAGAKSFGNKGEAAMAKAPPAPKGKLFRFIISNSQGFTLPGKVHYVNLSTNKDLAVYNTNDYADIIHPGTNQETALVCGVFGYKQIDKYLDYGDPSTIEGAFRDEYGAWVIPYELKRLEKGDVSIMYNVSFYKDASIMLPTSKPNLDELVKMMIENPNYKITIHGHCNGKYSRKIIAMGAEQEFFDINGSKEIHGSPKTLSALRAENIRNYLLLHGIDAKRIQTYAWGGKYMLVDDNSEYAKLNDRIEIEIRKD
jgi:outer membrane protein OmpA-like peptidoglycan-associated protein